MMLVTGGAGFIGSNVVASLNEAGRTDIAVNDVLGTGQNGATSPSARSPILCRRRFSRWLDGRKLEAVVHLGAISATTATDADLVIETNFRLSLRLLDWCTATARRSSMRPRPRPMATAPPDSSTTVRPRR